MRKADRSTAQVCRTIQEGVEEPTESHAEGESATVIARGTCAARHHQGYFVRQFSRDSSRHFCEASGVSDTVAKHRRGRAEWSPARASMELPPTPRPQLPLQAVARSSGMSKRLKRYRTHSPTSESPDSAHTPYSHRATPSNFSVLARMNLRPRCLRVSHQIALRARKNRTGLSRSLGLHGKRDTIQETHHH